LRLRLCVCRFTCLCTCAGVRKYVCACVFERLSICVFVCFGVFVCLLLRYFGDSFSLALTRDLCRGLSLYFFVSFSCALVLNLSHSHSESKPIFLLFTRALFASLQQRLSFFFRVTLFRSLTCPLSHPLFLCLSQSTSLSIRVTFCRTSLVPPPPLIVSSLGL